MNKYEDIIHLEHHTSRNHPKMSMNNRSAQFAPFSALSGYEDAIMEASIDYDDKIILSSSQKEAIDKALKEVPKSVRITYFIPLLNERKGKYQILKTTIDKVDLYRHEIVVNQKKRIKMDDIYKIDILE